MADKKPLIIEYLPVNRLVPYAGNARLHSDEQIQKIAASIKRFGFNNPVLIDAANTIVAGHGRLMAAKLLGLTEAPVVRLGHLSDQERRAYTLADNRIAEDAKWDTELLAKELAAIEEEGLAQLAGFTDKEVERLLLAAAGGGGGNTDPNHAPAPGPVPVSGGAICGYAASTACCAVIQHWPRRLHGCSPATSRT